MKKSILTKLAALAAVTLSLSFASCNEKGGASGSSKSGGMKFIKINGGTVTTADPDNNTLYTEVERSRKTVEVAPFEIADSETTYGKWYEVYEWATSDERGVAKYTFANYGREGSDGTDGNAPTANKNEPVTEISWRDAVVWCNAASEKDGLTPVYKYNGEVLREAETDKVSDGKGKAEKATVDASANGYRLPTEAEWEFAARGGDPAAKEWSYKYAGTDDEKTLKNYAVYDTNKTAAVKSKKSNSAGLYDMSGNVYEWCYDRYSASSFAYRVVRGGFYSSDASDCAVSYRLSRDPLSCLDFVGFRVVRSSSK